MLVDCAHHEDGARRYRGSLALHEFGEFHVLSWADHSRRNEDGTTTQRRLLTSFEHMPELRRRHCYPVCLLLMALAGIALHCVLRRAARL